MNFVERPIAPDSIEAIGTMVGHIKERVAGFVTNTDLADAVSLLLDSTATRISGHHGIAHQEFAQTVLHRFLAEHQPPNIVEAEVALRRERTKSGDYVLMMRLTDGLFDDFGGLSQLSHDSYNLWQCIPPVITEFTGIGGGVELIREATEKSNPDRFGIKLGEMPKEVHVEQVRFALMQEEIDGIVLGAPRSPLATS